MRDPDRIEPLLDLLERAWLTNPDLRLGQLVMNAASMGGWPDRHDVFNVEDLLVETGLRRILEQAEQIALGNTQEPE